ncbi:DUF559 domain-containing protein [Leucobacter sp. Z1108]|uniref:DUF559 domain-containing protein n=1 Tax=Leucobacter sp. Z1108 TaxID=3439066 RepID=UPI003F3B0948
MKLESVLHRQGGVVSTAYLRRAGHSFQAIAKSVESGVAERPRRGWIALRGADPLLKLAAQNNAVLTCVSAAKLQGLWVLSESRPHLATRSGHARAPETGGVVHWATPPIPRHPEILVDPVENFLDCVARCQPHESALTIFESALNKRLITRIGLLKLPMSAAARRLLEVATPFADSGLESIVASRLQWLRVPVVPQAWVLGHRVDLLIGERLIVQIDGAHHTGAQRDEDIRHDAYLLTHGYLVIRVSYAQVLEHWPEVQSRIMSVVAQGLHLA